MERAYLARVIRDAEEEPLRAGRPLMRHAAFALAQAAVSELKERGFKVMGSEILLLVGGGNNGGDVLYAGGELARRGAHVRAFLATDHPHEEGWAYAKRNGVMATELDDRALGAGVWIDGLTGLGFAPPLRGDMAETIELLNAEKDACADEPIVIATDLPSGLTADEGRVPGPVLRADVTLTFGGLKPALLLPPACYLAGRVDVVDLDLVLTDSDVASLGRGDVEDLFDEPGPTDHKYTRGVVTLIAGSEQYPGAGVLAAAGAASAGAGLIRMVTTDEVRRSVLAIHPEVTFGPGRSDALVAGPGLTDVTEHEDLIRASMGHIPVVLDAGALTLASRGMPESVLLTPHAGELADLFERLSVHVSRDEIEADPSTWARRAHEVTGATVLVKGGTDVIAGRSVYAQRHPSSWGAVAGAGDVYAGLVGALLARNPATAEVAAAASWIHGQAGQSSGPITGLERAHTIAEVLRG